MKLFSIAILATLIPLTGAGVSGPVKTGAAGYTGPGDVVAGAIFWVGLRAYTAAIASTGTQKVINISRASDSHTCDVLVASNGGLGNTTSCSNGGDNGESATTFCNATTCNITEFYDQSGGTYCSGACNFTQATGADQPTLVFNSGVPTSVWAGGQQMLTGVTGSSLSQPNTISAVANNTTNTGTYYMLFSLSGGSIYTGWNPTANTYAIDAGAEYDISGINQATEYALQIIFNGTSSLLYSNGSASATGNASTNPFTNGVEGNLAAYNVGNDEFIGDIWELGLWNSGFNSTQQSNMNSNQRTYWNF